jgi:hypothetical protein
MIKNPNSKRFETFEPLGFDIVSDFDIRASDFHSTVYIKGNGSNPLRPDLNRRLVFPQQDATEQERQSR